MPARNSQPHILAVNDVEDVVSLLREILEEGGYRVTTMSEALPTPDEVATLAPDLAIVDYIWGSADAGWSLLEQMREEPRTRYLPIILLTGAMRQLEPVRDQLAAMNVTVVLTPFDIDELVRTVAEMLGQNPPSAPEQQGG